MKLLPYHNPEKVDESRVPDGWRFLYADEAGKSQNKPCRLWIRTGFGGSDYNGYLSQYTYIVPVNA